MGGTLNDFIGIAVVAFFTDFTIDAIGRAAAVLKNPVPTLCPSVTAIGVKQRL